MPGLRLTPAQAIRLWGLERDVCQIVIERLIAGAFLRWTQAGELAYTVAKEWRDFNPDMLDNYKKWAKDLA